MDLNLPGSGQTVQQTFSVFDYDTGKYRYYVAPIPALPLTGHYRAPRGRTPESLAERVPTHAKPAGEGDTPKGVVASLGGIGEAQEAPAKQGSWLLATAIFLTLGFIVYKRERR